MSCAGTALPRLRQREGQPLLAPLLFGAMASAMVVEWRFLRSPLRLRTGEGRGRGDGLLQRSSPLGHCMCPLVKAGRAFAKPGYHEVNGQKSSSPHQVALCLVLDILGGNLRRLAGLFKNCTTQQNQKWCVGYRVFTGIHIREVRSSSQNGLGAGCKRFPGSDKAPMAK